MSQKAADRIIEFFLPGITILIAAATLFLSNTGGAFNAGGGNVKPDLVNGSAAGDFFFSQFGNFLLLAIMLLFAGLLWSRYQAKGALAKLPSRFRWDPLTKELLNSQSFWNSFFSVFTFSNPADERIMKTLEARQTQIKSLEKSLKDIERKLHQSLPGLVTN